MIPRAIIALNHSNTRIYLLTLGIYQEVATPKRDDETMRCVGCVALLNSLTLAMTKMPTLAQVSRPVVDPFHPHDPTD